MLHDIIALCINSVLTLTLALYFAVCTTLLQGVRFSSRSVPLLAADLTKCAL